ncbi:MAG: hypothetical protein WCX79_00755 [Candidatus Paceibacterota bacterium]|jgi:DNA-directed RNA polymerase subunit RPC12/RpoP
MSDALSDIRKADRNRPRYSQVEYEDAIRKAREEERNKCPTFDSIANEIRLTDAGYVKCKFDGKCECDTCGKKSKELYTHLDWETNESDGWVCPDCAFKVLRDARTESFLFNQEIENDHIKEIQKEANPFNRSCLGNIHDCPCEDECGAKSDCFKFANIINKHEIISTHCGYEKALSDMKNRADCGFYIKGVSDTLEGRIYKTIELLQNSNMMDSEEQCKMCEEQLGSAYCIGCKE